MADSILNFDNYYSNTPVRVIDNAPQGNAFSVSPYELAFPGFSTPIDIGQYGNSDDVSPFLFAPAWYNQVTREVNRSRRERTSQFHVYSAPTAAIRRSITAPIASQRLYIQGIVVSLPVVAPAAAYTVSMYEGALAVASMEANVSDQAVATGKHVTFDFGNAGFMFRNTGDDLQIGTTWNNFSVWAWGYTKGNPPF